MEKIEKIVLITDASTNLGFNCILNFARNNNKVYGILQDKKKKPQIPKNIQRNVKLISIDFLNKNSISKAISSILKENNNRIDILINNLDKQMCGSIENIDSTKAVKLFQSDYFGYLELLQKVIPVMRNENDGKIINICSLTGESNIPFFSHYSACKAALTQLSSALRIELKPFHIQVTSLVLGYIHDNLEEISKEPIVEEAGSIYARYIYNTKSEIINNIKKGLSPHKVAGKIQKLAEKKKLKPKYYLAPFPQSFWLYLTRFVTRSIEEEIILSYFKFSDKRRFKRISIHQDVNITSGKNKYKVHLININRKGIKFKYYKDNIKIEQNIELNKMKFKITLLSNDMDNRIARVMFNRIIPKGEFSKYVKSFK
ncbi:MAG: SDR family NAD(P)-dependent oxidoreductase [Spirochaetes bacterium]|nr:SDR family NAD(P)-dependent oxidoreductase [Spirochaetota bacterium]